MGIELKPKSFIRLRLLIQTFDSEMKEITSVVECNAVVTEIVDRPDVYDSQGFSVPLVQVSSHGEVTVTQTVGGYVYDSNTHEVRPI